MTKTSRQKFKYLEKEKSFRDEIKSIFTVLLLKQVKKFFVQLLIQITNNCRIPGTRPTYSPVNFTREHVGQIIFLHFSNSLVNMLAKSLVNMLAEALVNMLVKSLVNKLDKPLVNMLAEALVNMFTKSLANMLAEALVNMLTKSLVNMMTKSLVNMLAEDLWKRWPRHWWICSPNWQNCQNFNKF